MKHVLLLLGLCGALFFFRLGGYGLIDPDEPFYALTAKEMALRNDPMTPRMFGSPQFEKPILFYWVLYGAFKTLGETEFAARLGPALAGTLAAVAVYYWALRLFRRRRAALLSAVIFAASLETVALSRLVLTDVFLCLFTTASFAFFAAGLDDSRRRAWAWPLAFASAALGVLTKGLLGALIPALGLAAYEAVSRRPLAREIPWGKCLLVFFALAAPWYAYAAATQGPGAVSHFFLHENVRRFFVAEHRNMDRWWFYPLGTLAGMFPWTAFVLPGLFFGLSRARGKGAAGKRGAFLFVSCAFWAPLAFLALAKSKLLSYPFPAFPAAAILGGVWLDRAARALRMGARLKPSLAASSAIFFGIVPAGIAAGLGVFMAKEGIPPGAPLFAFAAAGTVSGWAALFFALRRDLVRAAAATAVGALGMTLAAFGWIFPMASAGFSSKASVEAYRAAARPESLLMGSKMVFRGVAFYSNRTVSVFAEDPRRLFYTMPPAPIVSRVDDLEALPASGFPLYGVLRERELNYLKAMTAGSAYRLDVSPAGGRKSLVRIERAAP